MRRPIPLTIAAAMLAVALQGATPVTVAQTPAAADGLNVFSEMRWRGIGPNRGGRGRGRPPH